MMERSVEIECKGRDPEGNPALNAPILVIVQIEKQDWADNVESTPVNCRFNTGGHGQRCKASHPEEDKVGEGVFCPFSFDWPYVKTRIPTWQPPEEIRSAFERVSAI